MPTKKTSPTQRTLKVLRADGYLCAIVEHWNPYARIRQDLFGFIDIIALKGSETLAVQTTANANNQKARVRKILASPHYQAVKDAGWKIRVDGWRKLKAGWVSKSIDL